MGDQTARLSGRLSLNPIHHIDPVGFLCMVFFHFGWAKPVPINMYNFKKRKLGLFLVSFAGPFSNIVLAFLIVVAVRMLALFSQTLLSAFSDFLVTVAQMSIGLAVFNLIPVPPLDGSKILYSFLTNRRRFMLQRY
jgi:Zn-dependent protease